MKVDKIMKVNKTIKNRVRVSPYRLSFFNREKGNNFVVCQDCQSLDEQHRKCILNLYIPSVGDVSETKERLNYYAVGLSKIRSVRSQDMVITSESLKDEGIFGVGGRRTVISVGRSPHGHKKAYDQFFVPVKTEMHKIPCISFVVSHNVSRESYVNYLVDSLMSLSLV